MCDYGIYVLFGSKKEMKESDFPNQIEASSDSPIAAIAIVDNTHEIESVNRKEKSHFGMVVLLHTAVNKYLYKLLQQVMTKKGPEISHIYFSVMNHRKGSLLMFKPTVKVKVKELKDLVMHLSCTNDEDAMVVPTYIYEPKSLTCGTSLIDYHKLVGNSIARVRQALNKMGRKVEGWSNMNFIFHYYNPHIIELSECGFAIGEQNKRQRYVIALNKMFGRSQINIFGSELGFPKDYEATFIELDKQSGKIDEPVKKTISHRRAGLSGSTDCCLWLSVLTMLHNYDSKTAKDMKDMMSVDKDKFRHMWILRSQHKQEETFDQLMRKHYGYYCKRRNETHLFHPASRGLFICLLKEENGKAIHAIAVERSEHSVMYDFEDQFMFQPARKLENFHGLTNRKKCIGIQIVAELIPPKRREKLFPFYNSE
jgi:hypothetical protein